MSQQTIQTLDGTYFDIVGYRLPATSQLNMMSILQDTSDNVKFMNIFRSYTIDSDVAQNAMLYYTHEVGHNEWWEYISYKYYETVKLWWVICVTNNVVNPFEELITGDLIKILKPQYIPQVLRDIDSIRRL